MPDEPGGEVEKGWTAKLAPFLHKTSLLKGSLLIFPENRSPTGCKGPSNLNILQRTSPKGEQPHRPGAAGRAKSPPPQPKPLSGLTTLPAPNLKGWGWGPRAGVGGAGGGDPTSHSREALNRGACLTGQFVPSIRVQRAVGGEVAWAPPQRPGVTGVALTFPEHCAMVARPSPRRPPDIAGALLGQRPPTKDLLGRRVRAFGRVSRRGAAQPGTRPRRPEPRPESVRRSRRSGRWSPSRRPPRPPLPVTPARPCPC